MIDKLKSCPFCGGEAHIAENVGYRGDIAYTVNCNAVYGCIASDSGLWYSSREAAVKAWNTRAVETCSVVASYSPSDMNEDDEWYFAFSCGHELYWDEQEPPKHCPNCGAKVVGE